MFRGREHWSTRIGFLLATIGSAVGLGNVWRFPFVVGQNGGGAYLVPYLISVLFFALPLMILELSVGRLEEGSVVTTLRRISSRLKWLGYLMAAIAFIILSYYLVITGWTLGYFLITGTGVIPSFKEFTSGMNSVIFFLTATFIAFAVVSKGIRGGIERVSLFLVPFLGLIIIGLALYALTLPGLRAALDFYLTPDLNKLSDPFIWTAAIGQAFFSLSVGSGILLTYGSYLEKNVSIPRSSVTITLSDLFVALTSGLIIFPIVFTFGFEPAAGPELVFTTFPAIFKTIPGGRLLAPLFFALLFFAAITSAISILETVVAVFIDEFNISRRKASLGVVIALIVVGLPSSLSYTPIGSMLLGYRILDLVDLTIGTYGLPFTALLLAITVSRLAKNLGEEINKETSRNPARLIIFLARFIIPTVLLLTLATQAVDGFKPIYLLLISR